MKRTTLALSIVLLASACRVAGPGQVPGDHFDYNAAIAKSSSEQLLLNLVRLRYSETPVFLSVASVISQYSSTYSLNASAAANAAVTGADTGAIGGRVVWTDRPTITYAPLSGQQFSKNLLTPIPPVALFRLMQSGWSSELVTRIGVWSINDVKDDRARPSMRSSGQPEFYEVLELWTGLTDDGVLGLRESRVTEPGAKVSVLVLREPSDDAARTRLARFRELLGLDASAAEIQVTYGRVPRSRSEVAVHTGSIWDIMLDLAWQFDVPEAHVASGRTAETFRSERWGPAPIQVLHGTERPSDAFVAVESQGYWFYIDGNDRRSKRAFSFLQLLLSLAEAPVDDQSPVVTITS
ncbi:MAG: hypothetical protein AAGB93_08705 [Planctomycetota bacterium]